MQTQTGKCAQLVTIRVPTVQWNIRYEINILELEFLIFLVLVMPASYISCRAKSDENSNWYF